MSIGAGIAVLAVAGGVSAVAMGGGHAASAGKTQNTKPPVTKTTTPKVSSTTVAPTTTPTTVAASTVPPSTVPSGWQKLVGTDATQFKGYLFQAVNVAPNTIRFGLMDNGKPLKFGLSTISGGSGLQPGPTYYLSEQVLSTKTGQVPAGNAAINQSLPTKTGVTMTATSNAAGNEITFTAKNAQGQSVPVTVTTTGNPYALSLSNNNVFGISLQVTPSQ